MFEANQRGDAEGKNGEGCGGGLVCVKMALWMRYKLGEERPISLQWRREGLGNVVEQGMCVRMWEETFGRVVKSVGCGEAGSGKE